LGVQVVVMVMIHEIFLVLCYLDDNFNNDVWALTMAVINTPLLSAQAPSC
jgi:hypothetical protein